jgi:glutamate transport system permease protein
MNAGLLGDALGPRGRRRTWVASIVAAALLAAGVVVAVRRFGDNGQLEGSKWKPLTEWDVLRFLLGGLGNTLRVALLAIAIALVAGLVMAVGRLASSRLLRWGAGAYVEFFRSLPLLLLVLFSVYGLRAQGVDISGYSALVLALSVYNSAILAEIFRAGILSIDRGQSEAAAAVGLGRGQVLRLIVLPQAIRRMSPAIVNQLVTLLKDTSLGFFIQYEELLRRGQLSGAFDHNLLQVIIGVAAMYIAVNFSLSSFARWLEARQRRRLGGGAPLAVAGAEDLVAASVPTAP